MQIIGGWVCNSGHQFKMIAYPIHPQFIIGAGYFVV